MGLAATLKEAASAGLAGAVTGGIGSIVSGGLGLLGGLFKRNNNGFKNQQKLMQQHILLKRSTLNTTLLGLIFLFDDKLKCKVLWYDYISS